MPKFLFALLLLLGVVFFLSRAAELDQILATLARTESYFLLLELGLLLLWLLAQSSAYQTLYAAMGVAEKTRQLLPVVLAANFANVVAPSGGASGLAVFVAESRRRGYSSAKVAAANMVLLEFDYLSLLSILAVSFVVLIRRQELDYVEIIATVILALGAAALALLLYLGARSGEGLARILTRLAQLGNVVFDKVLGRSPLPEEQIQNFVCEIASGLQVLRRSPYHLLKPFLLSLSARALQLLILALIFTDFETAISPGTLVASFSISALFTVVSPTPAGIGVVEGIMALTLASMYVPAGSAAVIALTYRFITFWLPLLLGLLAFRWLQKSAPAP